MRLHEIERIPFADVIEKFKQERAGDIKKGFVRNKCNLTAGSFKEFAKKHGYTANVTVGEFRVDNPEFGEFDFHENEIRQMEDEGFNFESKEDRIKFAQKHDMVEELKLVPHYWNIFKGKIIDFTANAQFVQTGLAADTKKKRYIKDYTIG